VKKSPRPYQQAAVDALMDNDYMAVRNPVVVMPTGSGKSYTMGLFIEGMRTRHPEMNLRFMVCAHVKELLSQNAAAIIEAAPTTSVGIYSASLGKRRTTDNVIVGGIASIFRKATQFGAFAFMIIDECHLVNPKAKGMYMQFIAALLEINPAMRIIGLTATPWRMNCGSIVGPGRMFDAVIKEVHVAPLIEADFLAPLIGRKGRAEADLSGVRIRGGEFRNEDLAKAFDKDDLNLRMVTDILAKAHDRKSILIFASGCEHADHLAECFKLQGEHSVQVVDGETDPVRRRAMVDQIRSGNLRILINIGVFTTGFDAPNIDCVVFARATQSLALYVQICGRGMRIAPGKADCLVLDYGENILRHGPVDAINWSERIDSDGTGEAPVKPCPACDLYVPAGVRICTGCGHEFPPPEPKLIEKDQGLDPMGGLKPMEVNVRDLSVSRHRKLNGTDSMKVSYLTDGGNPNRIRTITEWVCFEHTGYPRDKAEKWAKAHGCEYGIESIEDALCVDWRVPETITIKKNTNGFFEVVAAKFAPVEEAAVANK